MCKILVVDDEPLVVTFVSTVLRRAGHAVLTAGGMDEAIEANGEDVGLLLVNHSIDRLPGRYLVEALLLSCPDAKVLRFSGHLEDDLRGRGELGPESAFIQKPFTAQQLISKIEEMIASPV